MLEMLIAGSLERERERGGAPGDDARGDGTYAQNRVRLLGELTKARQQIAKAKTAKQQSAALDAYSASLTRVLSRMAPIDAPPAFAPTLESQRSAVTRVRDSAVALSHGLRNNNRISHLGP